MQHKEHVITTDACARAENYERAAWRAHVKAVGNYSHNERSRTLVDKTWRIFLGAVDMIHDHPKHGNQR